MAKKIKVLIIATQKVTYKQEREVDWEEWLVLQDFEMDDVSASDPDSEECFKILERHIDFGDIYEGESEFENVTIAKAK